MSQSVIISTDRYTKGFCANDYSRDLAVKVDSLSCVVQMEQVLLDETSNNQLPQIYAVRKNFKWIISLSSILLTYFGKVVLNSYNYIY